MQDPVTHEVADCDCRRVKIFMRRARSISTGHRVVDGIQWVWHDLARQNPGTATGWPCLDDIFPDGSAPCIRSRPATAILRQTRSLSINTPASRSEPIVRRMHSGSGSLPAGRSPSLRRWAAPRETTHRTLYRDPVEHNGTDEDNPKRPALRFWRSAPSILERDVV